MRQSGAQRNLRTGAVTETGPASLKSRSGAGRRSAAEIDNSSRKAKPEPPSAHLPRPWRERRNQPRNRIAQSHPRHSLESSSISMVTIIAHRIKTP